MTASSRRAPSPFEGCEVSVCWRSTQGTAKIIKRESYAQVTPTMHFSFRQRAVDCGDRGGMALLEFCFLYIDLSYPLRCRHNIE